MLGFTPFKKHANKFNYIPRFYNPEKEAREQRRAELRGERSQQEHEEYRPGQYIRTQRDARDARRAKEGDEAQGRLWKMLLIAVIVILVIYMLYPRLMNLFISREQRPPQTTVVEEEFNPYTPITIVPNDYEEPMSE